MLDVMMDRKEREAAAMKPTTKTEDGGRTRVSDMAMFRNIGAQVT
jgi:hypothetical protein